MRENWLSNRIFKSFDDIVDHCCDAWNKLIDQPWRIMSLGLRDWAYRVLIREFLALQVAEDKFGALHDWINGHLADELSLLVLADQAGMSERSFSRRYAEATGHTPARAIERLRVEAARRQLSESRLPVKRIAQRCGFGSEETLRRSFLRLLAVTPQDYRSRFKF